jgi:hypothetical protein
MAFCPGLSGSRRGGPVKPIGPVRYCIGERLGRDLAPGIGHPLQHGGRLFCGEVRRPREQQIAISTVPAAIESSHDPERGVDSWFYEATGEEPLHLA